MTIYAPGGPKMTFSLASCSNWLNAAMEWGTRFEILRKEKWKQKGSFIHKAHVHGVTICFNNGM